MPSSASPTAPPTATRRRSRTGWPSSTPSSEVDRVVLVYNTFVSALTQSVTDRDILPISADVLETDDEERRDDALRGDFIFEPEPEEILARLLPVYLETQVYRALLESAASEQGARMTAMRNASKNAGELIDRSHAGDEPRPPGGDHPGDPRGRRRRRRARNEAAHCPRRAASRIRRRTRRYALRPRREHRARADRVAGGRAACARSAIAHERHADPGRGRRPTARATRSAASTRRRAGERARRGTASPRPAATGSRSGCRLKRDKGRDRRAASSSSCPVLVAFAGAPIAARSSATGRTTSSSTASITTNSCRSGRGRRSTDPVTGEARRTLLVLGATDTLGRDEFLRLLYGAQVSLEVAVVVDARA